ncbi:GntR family transcriptional regulator [Schumannella sp. 10F1B-5-1]|uniref:GntR family transcriptional regulator n=1 Tax=Schumannella sp. 10F1B-5-1 TaxID=2590780 RepID=UPI00112FFD6F|nr:GntR family transcriptional regulator [Schumannella sp. 10F1B-5-1]TPW78416.1 GntR family transcriptional regulator [Schumannella sp. 10F1B-5-1]
MTEPIVADATTASTALGATDAIAPDDRSAGALTAADRAYAATKESIIRGDLASGALLSEAVIAGELGISRTPVHEAFLRLAAEGLLTLESRRGAVVRPLSPSEADDVLEMREAVEAACAARIIASDRVDEVLPTLRSLLEEQRAAVAADDLDRFIAADDGLHAAVVAGARNPVASQFATLLHDRQQRMRNLLIRVKAGQMAAAFDEHAALVAAIEARDAGEYAAVLRRHVDRNRGVL